MKPAPFEYHRPATLDEALALLEDDEDAKPLAGGQSLVPMLNFRLARPSALIDLGAIDGLAGIRREDGTLVVGAMTRQRDPSAPRTPPLLREALAYVGHTATRCRGTVGGSLAHADPTAELPVCALALGAELVDDRRRRTIPAAEFFVSVFTTALEPGELLVEMRFPRARRRDRVRRARPPRTATSPSSVSPETATGWPSAASPRRPFSGTAASSTPSATCSRPAGYKREGDRRALIARGP